jgi:hypothetical protein
MSDASCTIAAYSFELRCASLNAKIAACPGPDKESLLRASEVWWRLGGRFNLGWRLRARWRAAQGLGGDFKQGEISARSAHLTTRWHERWPNQPPLLPGVATDFKVNDGRSVRFHSLPESKQFPDTDDEKLELLHRHLTALGELMTRYGSAELVVIMRDWHTNDLFGGWTKKYVPQSWPWLSWRDPRDDDDDPFAFYWVAPMTSVDELSDLLLLVASDTGNATISDQNLTWLYFPYAGGADVVLPSTEDRNDFRDRHPDWRPKVGPGS